MTELIPHDFQDEARQFILDNPEAFLMLDCGMGKTITCLLALDYLLADLQIDAVLIIAPLRVTRLTWPIEIEDWEETSWMNYTILHGPDKDRNLFLKRHIYLINYEGMLWLMKKLDRIKPKNWPFQMVIYDESTKMKNPSSKRFKKWKKFVKHFDRKVAMTGTPAPKSLYNLFSQMFIIDEGKRLGTSAARFETRFFQKDYTGHKLSIRCPESEDKIYDLISDVTLSMKAEEYLDMPAITVEDIECKLPAKAQKHYDQMEKEFFTFLDSPEAEVEALTTAVMLGKCLQIAGGGLFYEVDEDTRTKPWEHLHDVRIHKLKELVKQHREPILVSYAFTHERERILKAFPKAVYFKAGMSIEQEQQLQRDWNAGKIPMLVAYPASVGYGLNLQKGCRIIVNFSPNWDLEAYEQFFRRVYRQGQTGHVLHYRFYAENTVDEVVLTALDIKKKGQEKLLKIMRRYRDAKRKRKK